MPNDAVGRAERLAASGRRDEARRLLLQEGFMSGAEPAARDAFYRLFPPSPALLAYLEGSVRQLGAPGADVRRKAARAIRVDAMKGYSVRKEEWLGDPRTTAPLIEALKDPDPAVVEEGVGALAEIVARYFADQRALSALMGLLAHQRRNVRFFAVRSLGHLYGEERWTAVLPLLADRVADVRGEAYMAMYRAQGLGTLTTPERIRLLPVLLSGLDDPDKGVRVRATNTIIALLSPSAPAGASAPLPAPVDSGSSAAVREHLIRLVRSLSDGHEKGTDDVSGAVPGDERHA
jgi:HEAT repeat protein